MARHVVVFTFDARECRRFWLTRDYLPEVVGLVAGWSLAELAGAIGARTEPVLIPWDCADGFFEAYWRRPEAYLDDHVRRAVSMWTAEWPASQYRDNTDHHRRPEPVPLRAAALPTADNEHYVK